MLSTTNPLQPKETPSYLAALKNTLGKAKVDNSAIAATHETRHGSLIIKCRQDQDLQKLQQTLSKNKAISKLARVSQKGPKKTKIIIKNIPYDLNDTLLNQSLKSAFNNFSLGRHFIYKNNQAFSQVVVIDEEKAKHLLSKPSPTVQIGPCYYAAAIFVPIVRCFNCQAFGHTYTECQQRNSYCATCGCSGHSSDTCQSSSEAGCINCYTHNNRASDHQLKHGPCHTAFSKNCPIFMDYFSRSHHNLLMTLIPQPPQQA